MPRKSRQNSDEGPDWTEAAEARALAAARRLAPGLGWGAPLARRAAAEAGLSEAEALLVLPGGARDLAALLSRAHDAAALESLALVDPASLKVRERIRRGVMARAEAAAAEPETVRRCVAYLSLPPNLPLGARLLWESADAIWRWAGDTATDENHYTKRAILSGVLANVVAARLDAGANHAAEVLDRRIEAVMAFEKWKAGLPRPLDRMREVAGALGRMRYR